MTSSLESEEYVESLFSHLLKYFPFQKQSTAAGQPPPIFTNYCTDVSDIFIPKPLSLEICTCLNKHIHHLYETDPVKYRWHVDTIRQQHPLTNPIVCEISRILCHAKKFYATANELAILVELNIPALEKVGVPAKVDHSLREALLFLTKLRDQLVVEKRIDIDHRLLFFVHEYDIDLMNRTFSECFQDIYALEFLIYDSVIPLPHWSSVMFMRNLYEQKYKQIQDLCTWNVLIENRRQEPLLLSHPLLPHPSDFMYTGRNPPNRPIEKRHIRYCAISSGSV